ncbi:hypothetical protein N7513_002664 [Penicillium frequentans]|nr:hypothetical protein N7513_002664 [Penicillium glabrum]
MSSRVGFRFLNNTRFAFRNATGPFRRQAGQGFPFPELRGRRRGAAEHLPANVEQPRWCEDCALLWALVIAGISDFNRPAEKLSLTQNGALMATGAIWTRWCLIIKPRNVLLATVNFFLGCVGVVQVGRIYNYRRSLDGSATETAKELEGEVVDSAKSVVSAVEGAAENAVKTVEKKTN